MKQLNAYINFDGNCREALNFYQGLFGGELTFMTVGETPMAGETAESNDKIMHGHLKNAAGAIMGSDMVGPQGFHRGTTFGMCVDCCTDEELRGLYEKLSEGGTVICPVSDSFWGAIFGMVVDKYGVPWAINFTKEA